MSTPVLVEVCVDSLAGALAAVDGGAGRLELCAGLVEGGTTPSLGLIEAVRAATPVDLVVLVRPRRGDFLYSPGELDLMARDIAHARDAGADGFALGILRADGSVDVERTRTLVEAADPLPVTFHRAFDLASDADRGLEAVLASGCRRLLSSGQAVGATDGLACLRALVEAAGEEIAVIPAGGLRPENVALVARESGAREVHLSASCPSESAMEFRREGLSLGAACLPREYERRVASAELVRASLAALAEADRA
ncbi:MAG: copper homeostasis protein CutC [Planctomycetota bacterium]|jgi:copper homeostasis protein|nr:copper homeostasis protein CutC [Planctomycetota bacterium]MDP6989120.1 copper homeostasis protein CutC [Planctomycetota bacterium]